MMTEPVFKLKAYTWKELGSMYSPELIPDSAARRLRKWVYEHPALMNDLGHTNFRKGLKVLTPIQVELITAHLGKP